MTEKFRIIKNVGCSSMVVLLQIVRTLVPPPLRAFGWRLDWVKSTATFRNSPVKTIARFIYWTVRELFSREISFQCPTGNRYVTMANNVTSLALFLTGFKDQEIQQFIERCAKPGWVFCDVGANIGAYSIVAARLAHGEGRVIAFEAHPYTYAFLERNVRVNGLSNVVSINKAVGDVEGSISLVFNRVNPGETHVSNESGSVPLVKLDNELRRIGINTINYLKIDVEGYELPVLRGAIQILRNSPDVIVQTEMIDRHASRYGYLLADLKMFMTGLGFVPHRVSGALVLIRLSLETDFGGDIIWVRNR
jgi:FkbM family methyltransferase